MVKGMLPAAVELQRADNGDVSAATCGRGMRLRGDLKL
jgi:hypothetical protein